MVADVLEDREDFGEVDHAPAQLTEYPGAHQLMVVPAIGLAPFEHVGVEVLEMDQPDAVAQTGDPGGRVAAAECVVAGVEADSQEVGIGELQKPFDLGGGLDVGGAVRVQRRPQARFALHRLRYAFRAGHVDLPARLIEPMLRADAARVVVPSLDGAVIVADVDDHFGAAHLDQQPGNLQRPFYPGLVIALIVEPDGHPGADHLEAP